MPTKFRQTTKVKNLLMRCDKHRCVRERSGLDLPIHIKPELKFLKATEGLFPFQGGKCEWGWYVLRDEKDIIGQFMGGIGGDNRRG